jgi:hypothetical protein
MNLAEFLAHARDVAAEMRTDPGSSSVELAEFFDAVELLTEYAQDARALEFLLEDLPGYAARYRQTIERLEGTYEQSAKRFRLENYVVSVESGTTSARIQAILSTIASEAGLAFIPTGRILVECGFADEITVRARLTDAHDGHSRRRKTIGRASTNGEPGVATGRISKPTAAPGPQAIRPARARRERRTPSSEKQRLGEMSELSLRLYRSVRKTVLTFGDDVGIGASGKYIKLMVAGANFAEVARRKFGLQLTVHSDSHRLAPGTSASEDGLHLKRQPATAGWTLDVQFDVRNDTDLNAVGRALRASYQAVKRRRGVRSD